MIWINVLLALLSVPVIILGGIKASEGKLWGEPIGYLAAIVLAINLGFIFDAIDTYRGKNGIVMENKFNFKSQTATSPEQSERLLALGLKKETADCYWFYSNIAKESKCTILSSTQVFKDYPTKVIPAWSLDRLKELYKCVEDTSLWNLDDVNYDRLIQCISLAIKHNSFNKEYLE